MTAAALLLAAASAAFGASPRGPAARAAPPPSPEPVARKVLVLYAKANIRGDVKDPFFLPAHFRAELPLNHLGLELVYHDLARPLPAVGGLKDYRGVLTWFERQADIAEPAPVCRWLSAAMDAGLKWVALGELGVYAPRPQGDVLLPECRAALKRLGVVPGPARTADPLSAEIVRADPAVLGFERKPDLRDAEKLPGSRLLAGATVYLDLRFHEDGAKGGQPVGLTPGGAVALSPFVLYQNIDLDPPQVRWVLDPFAFFESAFRLEGLPRPDPTTLAGRRVYFSQVDGDGFFNRSELDTKKGSAEVFLREFVDAWPESPFTLSLITGYYDLAVYNDERSRTLSREMLSRRNVEPASHGYAHPLVWRKGTVSVNIPGYSMDARREILDSSATIDRDFLPASRKVRLFQWTGDCLPTQDQLALASRGGLLTLNGGGGRFDSRFPSYGFLFPLSRTAGGHRQVYAGTYNENDFTGQWQGPYYGYREAIETFERTGSPRRVKPVDVYVHFYSAEKYASVEALRKVYAWVRARPLHPVRASDYVKSVHAFFDMRVQRLGDGRFRFEGGEALRTVRFDGEPRDPDLALSPGVVGFKREAGSLFVSFDETPVREVKLAERPRPLPHIVEANFAITGLRRDDGRLRFSRSGWWTGEMVVGGLRAGASYRVSSAHGSARARAGDDGVLRFSFPDSEFGGAPREVTVEPEG